jgi:transposase
MLKVDQIELIRRKVLVDGQSIRETAKELGHSRGTVTKALEDSSPRQYKRTQPVRHPVLEDFIPIIDALLETNSSRPRKQRLQGSRIYQILCEDYEFTGSVSAVRRYVAKAKATSGEKYFPLAFDPGEEGQVDWGEARCVIGGVERKVLLFCVRLCHSTASYVRAYERQNMESLLDGHVRAFAFFGGVPRCMAYDNLKTVVISVGRGQDRRLTQSFKELRAHFLFTTRFCNVAAGNEKGHVENLVKHAQRTFMTPLPGVSDLDSLNAYLEKECEKDLDRLVESKRKTRRALWAEEKPALLPIPRQGFDACRRKGALADKQSLVRFDNVLYSVPVRWAHHHVSIKGFVDRVEIFHEDELIARHKRSYEKGAYILDFEHYLPLLERKPGGILNGRPFKGEPWGEAMERMRGELLYRYDGEGTRQFVRILLLFTRYPPDTVKDAVARCVRHCAFGADAVEAALNYLPPRRIGNLDLSSRPDLAAVTNPPRSANIYAALCGEGVVQ